MQFSRVTAVAVTIVTLCFSVDSSLASDNVTQIISKNIFNREGHNLIIGERVNGDGLLYFQTVYVKYKLLWFVTLEVSYPSGNEKATINYIEVIDLKTDGSGGYVSVISGGVGNRSVTFRIKSQFSRDVSFNISVFGK